MKKILLFLIYLYQAIVSSLLKNALGIKSTCRFTPTCSAYASAAINKYGATKGSYLAILRILSCQPFYSAKLKVQSVK